MDFLPTVVNRFFFIVVSTTILTTHCFAPYTIENVHPGVLADILLSPPFFPSHSPARERFNHIITKGCITSIRCSVERRKKMAHFTVRRVVVVVETVKEKGTDWLVASETEE